MSKRSSMLETFIDNIDEESFFEKDIPSEILDNLDPNHLYREYPYRYLILLLFGSTIMCNQMMFITCSPIQYELKHIYSVSDSLINLCSLVYMLVSIPVNFISYYALDDLGLRLGVVLGAAFTITGSCLRLLINKSFYFVLLGQIFGAFGQPFLLNAPAKIAAFWFAPKSRTIATTFLSVVCFVGNGIGFVLPSVFVHADTTDPVVGKAQGFNLMLGEAIITVVLAAPTLCFFKGKPPSPPSFSAQTEKVKFLKSFRMIFKNKDYILLFFFFATAIGNFNIFSTVIEVVIKPFGFNSSNSSVCGVLLIVFGLIGAFFFGFLLEKYRKYKKMLIFNGVWLFIVQGLLIGALYLENIILVYLSVIFIGFFVLPVQPICFELACELAFPIGEAFSAGILVAGSQIVGFIEGIVMNQALDGYTKKNSVIRIIVIEILNFLGFLCVVVVKENLKRSNIENKHDSYIKSKISERNSPVNFKGNLEKDDFDETDSNFKKTEVE